MKMLGNFTHGHSTETGCCEPSKYRMRQSHRSLHEREVRRYRDKEKRAFNSEIQDELVELGIQPMCLEDYITFVRMCNWRVEEYEDSYFIAKEFLEEEIEIQNVNYYPAA